MQATVRTTCAVCGTVEVAIASAQLLLALQGDDLRNTLQFTCPKCGRARGQRVGERGTRLLNAAGVRVVTAQPQVAPAAGALSRDDGEPTG